jgi:hypothetical protein
MHNVLKKIIKRVWPSRCAERPSWAEHRSRINALVAESSRGTKTAARKQVAFLNVRGWPLQVSTDALAVAALQKRGNSVLLLSCSESLPFCMYGPATRPLEEQRDCLSCCSVKSDVFSTIEQETLWPKSLQLPARLNNEIQNLSSIKECTEFSWRSQQYGSQVYASLAWFLRRSKLRDEDIRLYKAAIGAAARTHISIDSFLDRREVDCFVLFNGDFTPEATAATVLKSKGVRFVCHDYAFEERLGVASDSSVWDDLTFNDKNPAWRQSVDSSMIAGAEGLIKQWKRKGGYQGQLFWNKATTADQQEVKQKVGLDQRPLAVAFTNLTYESSVVGKDRTFESQFKWIDELVRWFSRHSQFQLAVRCHPAEERKDHWKPTETITEHLRMTYRVLPENIKLIGPADTISSYSLGDLADAVLVYSSTIGLEFAEAGKPTVTAAHVHYADRGFTIDPRDPASYFSALYEHLSNHHGKCPHSTLLARDYVAWLMFKRTLPIEGISNMEEYWPHIGFSRLSDIDEVRAPNLHKWVNLISTGEKWW